MKVTAEDIAQLLASPPPRVVPPHVQRAVQGGGCAPWFLPVFGLVFAGFGMVFVVVFFPWKFVDEFRLAASDQTVPGRISSTEETHMSVNDIQVMRYQFSYTLPDGKKRDGVCYTTGLSWSAGATVTVRYLRGSPEVACVAGARLSQGGWFGVFVLFFPLVGSALTVWFVLDRLRTRHVLRDGAVAEVDVVSVNETGTQVNYQSVYRIVLAGPALAGGQPVTVKRVKKADVNLALKHARDQQPVFILYDPRKPSRVIFPEALIDA